MTVSILGCGWLGRPLAERLVAAGHAVRGSTRTAARLSELAALGVDARRLDLDTADAGELAAFAQGDALVVSVPPGGVADDAAAMRRVGDAARSAGVRRVVFTSSTSVYPDPPRVVTEADAGPTDALPLRRSGPAVWAAENALRATVGDRLVVLRLGGLVGRDRQPARFLAGRRGVPRPRAPVNLVHQRDAVRAIERALDEALAPGAYSVVAPEHPSREAYYTAEATRLGLAPPHFAEDAAGGKTVSPAAFEAATGWRAAWRPGDAV